MKKSLLLLASLSMSVASFAQWTAPAPTNVQEMATDGTEQYLYNKEAGGFFAGGNDWGTRASVATTADPIKFALVDGDNYNFCCYPAAKNNWLYVSCNAYDAMWVDAPNADASDNYPGTDTWQIKKNANGSYTISNTDRCEGVLGVAEIYRGEKGNTRVYINDQNDTYDVEGEMMPSISGKFYSEWYFIDEDEYKALQPKVITYLAAINLEGAISRVKIQDATYDTSVLNAVFNNTSSTKEELDAATAVAEAAIAFSKALATAQATYPNLDFSAPIATYKNNKSTKEELEAAKNQIQEIINNFLATQASFEEPISFDLFGDNGVDAGKWIQEFTGDGQVGSWHTNTWSTEADGGADGTDMTTPFCEDWVANGSLLSNQKIYQVLAGAAPGLYKFHANVRLYNEAGGVDALTGCTMYFGDNQIDLSSKVAMYKSGNKCVLWKNGGFDIIAIVTEASDIEFGFNIQDPTFNWMAFKDLSVKYYGNENVEQNAILLTKGDIVYEKYEEGEANEDVIAAYNDAVDAFNNASTAAEIEQAVADITVAKDALDKNIAAYKNLLAKIESWEQLVGENEGLVGSEWDDFCDFLQGEEIAGYPTPTPTEIKEGDRSLTTEEIDAYIDSVDKLYAAAVAACIQPGVDCTHMLINPGFTDPNGKGWTVNNGINGGGCGNYAPYGGLIPTAEAPNAGFPVAESWHATFDVFQEISGVQDGIYSLSLNGFCRLDDGVDSEVPAEIYMNEFATSLQNILDGGIPESEGTDGFNCYLTNGMTSQALTTNPIFIGGTRKSPNDATDTNTDGYLTPNGMEGASVAFSSGRYLAKVYGLVEGGKMRIGVRNTKSTHVWALWSNFKLTYEGKSAEALESILPIYVEKLTDYAEENEDYLTDPEVIEIAKVINQAEKASDADELYNALIAVNSELASAQENVAAAQKLENDILDLLIALELAPESNHKYYYAIEPKLGKTNTLTTAELNQLISEVEEVTDRLLVPDGSDASDETPVDFTSVIKNPDFEANVAGEQATGWTLVKGETASGNYQVQTGYDGGVSMEFWSPTNGSGTQFDFYQTLKYLPAGTYELTVEASNSLNDVEAGTGDGSANIYVSVNGREQLAPISVQEVGCRDDRNTYSIVFTINEGENVVVGAKNVGELSARWVMVDNFQLTYYGTNSKKADPTAITEVNSSISATEIYSTTGARTNGLQKGINIVKMSNGSVKKVLVK